MSTGTNRNWLGPGGGGGRWEGEDEGGSGRVVIGGWGLGGGGREWERGSYTGNCNLFKHFLVCF